MNPISLCGSVVGRSRFTVRKSMLLPVRYTAQCESSGYPRYSSVAVQLAQQRRSRRLPCAARREACCEPSMTPSACCAQSDHTTKTETETYDIYLVPPGEDPETTQSWLRMRNRDGRYNLMFEEWVTEGPFIISPRITFEVRVLRGCRMALSLSCPAMPCSIAGPRVLSAPLFSGRSACASWAASWRWATRSAPS